MDATESTEPTVVTTVEQYLATLPADRRDAIAKLRDIVNANLPPGYEEGIQYGMIGWYVPLSRYPVTYNGQPLGVAALGSQKNHMAIYLTSVYGDPTLDAWFRSAFAAAGKKLDMGKSCVRFKSLDALPLDVIGETIGKVGVDQFVARYEEVRALTAGGQKTVEKSARATRTAATAAEPTRVAKPAPAAKRAAAAPSKPVKAAAKTRAAKPATATKKSATAAKKSATPAKKSVTAARKPAPAKAATKSARSTKPAKAAKASRAARKAGKAAASSKRKRA